MTEEREEFRAVYEPHKCVRCGEDWDDHEKIDDTPIRYCPVTNPVEAEER